MFEIKNRYEDIPPPILSLDRGQRVRYRPMNGMKPIRPSKNKRKMIKASKRRNRK